jgi:crotonobetaine/carnitine-CoA ligase
LSGTQHPSRSKGESPNIRVLAVKRFQDTVPHNVVFCRFLEDRAAASSQQTFFTYQEKNFAYGDFNLLVNRIAHCLLDAGVLAGTRVAVLMDTSPEYLALWFALAKIGAIEIPINTAYHGDMLLHPLVVSDATMCIIDAGYRHAFEALAGATAVRTVYVRGGNAGSRSALYRDFAELLAPNRTQNPDVTIDHDEVSCVIFTSGTTGRSKGVLLSHHYLTAYGYMYAEINALRDDDVIMNFLPFFHIAAKFLTIATLVCGGKMRLLPRLSISTFLDEVRAFGVTNFVGVGGICNMLLSRPPDPSDLETTIRTIYAVPDPADIHEELERRFKCTITTVYGSTEAGLPIVRGAADEYRPGSCGRASPYYEVAIVDEYDNELPVGLAGEVVVRPKRPFLVASGYIGMADRTVAAWRNLWLHTGDRARADADGWFYFEDRVTDSIRRRGENISSFEVEMLVGKHPAVAEVAAVSAESEIGEGEVRVFLILRNGHTATHEELMHYCSKVMPYFMVPRFIDIVEELPRTPTAKVEKYKLRTVAIGPQTWDREKHGWKIARGGLVSRPDADDGHAS